MRGYREMSSCKDCKFFTLEEKTNFCYCTKDKTYLFRRLGKDFNKCRGYREKK